MARLPNGGRAVPPCAVGHGWSTAECAVGILRGENPLTRKYSVEGRWESKARPPHCERSQLALAEPRIR